MGDPFLFLYIFLITQAPSEKKWTELSSIAEQFGHPSLQSAMIELDQSLYSNDADAWNGKKLWGLISKKE